MGPIQMRTEANLTSAKIGSAASEEKSFENVNGRTHGRTDDRRKVTTIAHPDQSSDELKRKYCHWCFKGQSPGVFISKM